MSVLDEKKWTKIDKNLEETTLNNIRFVRPLGYRPVGISCTLCGTLIATIEDVEAMKEASIRECCHTTYYYHNKDKWKKGWRPNIKS